jgi:predicted esterase
MSVQVLPAGDPLPEARAAGILLHGRGGSAADILSLARFFWRPGLAFLAPQAPDHTWYPSRFLAPFEENEPALSESLATVGRVVEEAREAGIPEERLVLVGFSQGACLASEWTARHGRRLGGLVAYTGGLIGPDDAPRDYPGGLAGLPAFLGSGDPDPHVPWERVEETAGVLERMGARVDLRRYPGIPHTIVEEELEAVAPIWDAVAGERPEGEA